MFRPLLAGLVLATASLLATTTTHAAAVADLRLAYTVNTAGDLPAITQIVTFNHFADGGGGAWWAAEVPGHTGSHTITDPFPKDSANAPLDALLIGLVQGLPGDGTPDQKHIVLMMSDAAAAAAQHIAWGTLFTQTLEDQLIAALELMTSGQDFPVIQPGIDAVDAFVNGDAVNGILGPGGMPISAWFGLGTPAPGTTVTSSFTVVAFSDGQIVGEGLASVSAANVVPEPASGTLVAGGLLMTAVLSRRRRG